VGLEWGPLSLVSTIEELRERKSSGSGLEIPELGRKGSATLTSLYPQNLALTSPTSGGHSFGIVRSRTLVRVAPHFNIEAIFRLKKRKGKI
jgi:hypothetical protein